MEQIIDWTILSANPIAFDLLTEIPVRINWTALSASIRFSIESSYDYKHMEETKRALHRDLFEHLYYPRNEIKRELIEHLFHPSKLESYLEMNGIIDGYLGYDL